MLQKSSWFCHESGPDWSSESSLPEQNWWEVASSVTVTLCWMSQGWEAVTAKPKACSLASIPDSWQCQCVPSQPTLHHRAVPAVVC